VGFSWKQWCRGLAAALLLLAISAWRAEALSGAQLTLTWADNTIGESGFDVERSTGSNGAFGQIATTGPGVTVYTDSSVAAGVSYCYRVRAFNATTDSDYSNVACATTSATFGLAVVKVGAGSGTVTSTPTGIVCGASCSGIYASGTAVTLAAAPAAGSTFGGWTGGGCSGTGSCNVTVSATTTITATFALSSPPPPPPPPGSGAIPTRLTISAPSISAGSNAAVTVAVSASSGTPTGTVSLSVDGGGALSATLSNGQAVFTLTNPSVGNHTLAAGYAAQAGFGASTGAGTLHVNTSTPPPTTDPISFGSSAYSANPVKSKVAIDIVRVGPATGSATVRYTTVDGTARAGVNYRAESGAIKFRPGETAKTIFVHILTSSAATSTAFNLALSNPSSNTVLGSPSTVTVTIAAASAASGTKPAHGGE